MKTHSIAGLSLTIAMLNVATEAVKLNDWWSESQEGVPCVSAGEWWSATEAEQEKMREDCDCGEDGCEVTFD